jgi:prepilin-type N-terminal cleavage/methylation domain-containing protein
MVYHRGHGPLLRGPQENFRTTRGWRRGFTLVEVITALALLSVAGFISVSLFSASHDLAASNRNQTVAGQLAREQLNRLLTLPEQYAWPDLDSLEPGEFGPVTLDEATGPGFQAPSASPALPQPTRAMRNLYENYTWEAYTRITETGIAYAEVVVAVRWKDKFRMRTLTLTGAVPRSALENAS